MTELIIGGLENDPNDLYKYAGESIEMPSPVPTGTAFVDAAIDLFSQTLLDQPLKIQESAISQIATSLSETSNARSLGRKTIIRTNIIIALSKAMSNLTVRGVNVLIKSERLTSSLVEVIHVLLYAVKLIWIGLYY